MVSLTPVAEKPTDEAARCGYNKRNSDIGERKWKSNPAVSAWNGFLISDIKEYCIDHDRDTRAEPCHKCSNHGQSQPARASYSERSSQPKCKWQQS